VWARTPDILAPRGGERAGARGFYPSSILHLPSSLIEVLPDGYIIEACPAAETWWREAASVLGRGKLMTIDYGLTADELFLPGRLRGTLRAYFRHHVSDDLLANVGQQDLTAHVNFSAIQAAGESMGLRTEMFSTQSQFLTQILEKASKANSPGKLVAAKRLVSPKSDGGGSEDGWTSAQARQFQTLTHPEHLGRAFRVLVQSR
jgi:SAM-dependent MidA family methyltransferase